MPQYMQPRGSSAPAGKRYLAPKGQVAPAASAAPEDDSSSLLPLVGAGALGLGTYALTRNPGAVRAAVSKGADLFNDVRRVAMLSGMAIPKSVLGNVGSSVYGSIERGSLAPLKEMFSKETAKDAWQTFKAGPSYEAAGPADLGTGLSKIPIVKYMHPGRVMGAVDTASQNALQRAGYTSKEAATEMLQAELPKKLSDSLKGPVGDYLVPFRRTPFNQLMEGFGAMRPQNLTTTGQKVALGTSLASGAATGAMAEDPKTIALGTAFSGRRGVPFALAAGISRALTSGSKNKGLDVIQGISPVSDYSLGEGAVGPVMDPSRLMPKPAAISAYAYLRNMLGMD